MALLFCGRIHRREEKKVDGVVGAEEGNGNGERERMNLKIYDDHFSHITRSLALPPFYMLVMVCLLKRTKNYRLTCLV